MKRLHPVQDQYAHVCMCFFTTGTRMLSLYCNTQRSGNNGDIHIRISFMMSGTVIVVSVNTDAAVVFL